MSFTVILDLNGVIGTLSRSKKSLKPFPGFQQFFDRLRDNPRIGQILVWTSTKLENIRSLVDTNALIQQFDGVLTQADCGPETEQFEHTKPVERIPPQYNVHAERCIIVDDSIAKVNMNRHYIVVQSPPTYATLYDQITALIDVE